MALYTCDPNTEVTGKYLLAHTTHMNHDIVRPFLVEHGLGAIDSMEWYALSMWMDVLNDLMYHGHRWSDWVSLGMRMADAGLLIPQTDNTTFEDAIRNLNYTYQLNHRGDNIGRYDATLTEENHLVVNATVAYPSDEVYGIVYGLARRYLPNGSQYSVEYDDYAPLKEYGGDGTIIHVGWAFTSEYEMDIIT